MSKGKKTTKTVFISDVHYPFEDEAALHAVYDLIEDLQPEEVVLIGDLVDFYDVSRFSKDPKRIGNLQVEINEAKSGLKRLREIVPDSKIYYIEGNHERRLEKYLMENPELASLDALSVENLLGLKELDIDYYPLGRDLKLGKYWIIHGDEDSGGKLSQYSAGSAKATTEKFGTSIIMGHSHRLGSFYKTLYDGEILEAYEIGCLSTDLDYIHNANWQRGIGLMERNGDTGTMTLIHIENGKFMYNGKEYGGGRKPPAESGSGKSQP